MSNWVSHIAKDLVEFHEEAALQNFLKSQFNLQNEDF